MYRILIVEDDEIIARSLKKHLESWDYDVVCVEDFSDIMKEFAGAAPQLVLMDMNFLTLLKNSLFLALGNALWALLMAAVQIVYWMAMLLLFPMSVLALALLGFVPVTVFCQQIAWRIMDKVFGLEDQFRKKREAELAEGMQE